MTNAITVKTPTAIQEGADVGALVAEWHQALQTKVEAGELSATTTANYIKGTALFIAWVEAEGVANVDADTVRAWKGALLAQRYKPGTVNVWLSGVRAFFAWALGARRLVYNPAADVVGAKRKGTSQKHKREALTSAEVLAVLAQPDTATAEGLRDRAILSVMCYAAVRSVECYRADLADVRTEGEAIIIDVRGKGRAEADEVVVVANPEGQAALREWLAVRGSQPGPLFTSLSNRARGGRLSLVAMRHIIKDYFARAGVVGKNKTTHSLRHTAITNAVRHGAPVQKVQSMARHANIATTMIYFHETDRVENPAERFIDYTNGVK